MKIPSFTSSSVTLVFLFYATLLSKANAATLIERVEVPNEWKRDSNKPTGDEPVTLEIGLTQQNLPVLIDNLYAVSDPDSESYGKFYEHHQVLDLIKPQTKHENQVVSWLRNDQGVKNVHSDGHWVTFVTNVKTANRLLNTDFEYYSNSDGLKKLRTTQYSVPDAVADAVDLILPTTYFGRSPRQITNPRLAPRSVQLNYTNKPCSEVFSPKCIKRAYKVGSYVPKPRSGSRVGFGNFVHNYVSTKDLFEFEKIFKIPKQDMRVEGIHGGRNKANASGNEILEGNLDSQTIMGVAAGLPLTGYFTRGLAPFKPDPREPDLNENEPYLPYLKYLLDQPNEKVEQVISHSYSEDEQTVPIRYASRVCNMMAALGVRGVTILFSSGDFGVGAACVSNDKKKHSEYTPEFPPSCPYVTAVGGTQNRKKSNRDELAWDGSGGGFSNYFSRPAYQNATVKNYFSQHVSKRTQKYIASFYNRQGRGYPDISARSSGSLYPDVQDGQHGLAGGTSASTPAWAGIIALLNDARLRNGQPTLGFLNPFLYKRGFKALNDIKEGKSTGCHGTDGRGYRKIPFASWNATEGWDPATGLGAPDFQKLRSLVLNTY